MCVSLCLSVLYIFISYFVQYYCVMCHIVILCFLLHCVKIADSIVYMYIVLVNILGLCYSLVFQPIQFWAQNW